MGSGLSTSERPEATSAVSHYRPAGLSDCEDEEDGEAEEMERWLGATRLAPERPDVERYAFNPTVLDELFEEAHGAGVDVDEANEQRLYRMERAFSQP
jgi:hypothetical protein